MNNSYLYSVIFLVTSAGLSFTAHAECPTSLKLPDLETCIVVEGAGQDYQDFLVEWNKPFANDKNMRSQQQAASDAKSKYIASTAKPD